MKHHHRLTGVVAPVELHAGVTGGLAEAGFVAVDHVHDLGHDDVPLFGPEQVKGLEFDGVVVVEPNAILDGTPRGARLLYVAMTRAVQELAFVTTGDPVAHPLTPARSKISTGQIRSDLTGSACGKLGGGGGRGRRRGR